MEDHLLYLKAHMELSDTLGRYYIDSTPVMKLGDVDILIPDLIASAVLSATNTYLMGTRGSGKTLLSEVVQRSIMNEDSLYLRGDKDLNLKDLMVKLNLEGKNQDEIYGIATENLLRPFFLIDELNRCIGLVQNQFLNIADGYIEIRGKKYYFGKPENGYSLMMATGNPPTNGDYTGVFDEDLALLDRIGLILNVDDYCLLENDTAEIKSRSIVKQSIAQDDMRTQVFDGNKALVALSHGISHYGEILAAYIFERFRKMKVGNKTIDKTQVFDWRALIQPGANSKGDLISLTSDISQRSLQEGKLAEALIFYYAGFKSGEGSNEIDTGVLIDAYLETLMLKLRYDRRFLPFDHIRENHDGNVIEFLNLVKKALKEEIDPAALDQCAGLNLVAHEQVKDGNIGEVQKGISYIEEKLGRTPIAVMTTKMLKQRIEKKMREDRREAVKRKLFVSG